MTISDMPVLPTTSGGKCPICGGNVPKNGMHACTGVKVVESHIMQQPVPLSFDREILAELKEIRSLLEAIRAEIS